MSNAWAVLQEPLDRLQPKARVAFAAACSERLLPTYSDFARQDDWNDSGSIRQALDAAWGVVEGVAIPSAELEQLLARSKRSIPRAQSFGSTLAELAESAACAVTYTLQCAIDGDSAQALYASDCLMEAIDVLAHKDTGRRSNRTTISSAAGLEWQELDLQELMNYGSANFDSRFVRNFRNRAARQSLELPKEPPNIDAGSTQSGVSRRFLRELRHLSAANRPLIEKKWREQFVTPEPVVKAAQLAAARALGSRKLHDAFQEAGSAVGSPPGTPLRRAAAEAAAGLASRDQISSEQYEILVAPFASVMPWLSAENRP